MLHGRWQILLGVLLAPLALSGCVALVAHQIEHPGRSGQKRLAPFRQMLGQGGFRYDTMRTRQDVRLAYWYGQPRDYRARVDASEHADGRHAHFVMGFRFRALAKAPPLPVRGSIVLLHPWGMEGSAMAAWGFAYAGAGYVTVMPDLRSQGRSGNAPVGYGPREAGDIVDLVRHLEAARRLPGPLYLLGASYGATVALFAAPRLPEVRGVIALEPYANAAAVIRRAPGSGLFGYRWLARWISPREMDEAVARASGKLEVNLAEVDAGSAVADAKRCTLILRGGNDMLVTSTDTQALARRSPQALDVEIAGEGHMTLPLRVGRLFPPLLEWIGNLPRTPAGICPGFAPLPP